MHGHPHQLIGHLHGYLVVGDKDELNPIGHLLDHARVPPTFASSSGASTSSSMQKGAGLSWKMENTRAIAVSAFSPPDSRWMVLFFLPGGRAMMVTPVSSRSSPVSSSQALPPPNTLGNRCCNPPLTLSKVSLKRLRVSLSILRITCSSVCRASSRSAFWASR